MLQLILGGARSGKSRLAESRALDWASRCGAELIYVATAGIGDPEMARRVAQHQERRGAQWHLIEEPENLAQVLAHYRTLCPARPQPEQPERQVCVLIDCLTLWISNCLHQGNWPAQQRAFIEQLTAMAEESSLVSVIMVSNEVGSGVVPLGELSRDFVDASGWLHQSLAQICPQVTLVVAGLPLELKGARRS